MTADTLLDLYLVEVRLKPENPGLAWVVSRLESRPAQERIIRYWNRYGEVPWNLERLVGFSRAQTNPWAA